MVFGSLLSNKYTYIIYLKKVLDILLVFVQYVVIIVPIFILFLLIIKFLYSRNNNKINYNTLPLKGYLLIEKSVFIPIKNTIISTKNVLNEFVIYKVILIIIWVLNINIPTIIFNAINYYLYFCISLDFESVLPQLNVLLYNLRFLGGPAIIVSIPLFIYLFGKFRKNIAVMRLRRFELKNKGFINDLPIVSLTCGSMGKKKTTILTDMALSQEVMFREKAFELLQKNDMRFPNFPWLCFEKQIQTCMRYGEIYNLASIKEWINKKKERFERTHNDNTQLYGYDYISYGLEYDDHLKVYNLFDVLLNYGQAYFIYIIESSLLVSNYSIREDNVILSEGNFPIWNTDFFTKRNVDSRHSHILDFDILRLGRKVIENNEKNGSFEFGIIVITEVGKERGNNLELKEIKKSTNETNQKNDLFNSWLKMCRHSATVDNYPFIKVFTDEQRPESWGADSRDLCDILTIIDSEKQRLALPFYTIQDLLSKWSYNRFISLYYDFRFRRGDNTLLVYMLKGLTTLLYKHNERIYNDYGYFSLKVYKEQGRMDGVKKKKKYYLMNKKIYSDRFCTDCFSDYFNNLAKSSRIGLNDYKEYRETKANIDELREQNSYFINSLYRGDGDASI